MVDVNAIRTLQADAKSLATDLGLVVKELTERELIRWGRSFERQLVLGYPQREVVDIFNRHMAELLLGAMVAKEQMSAEVDGEMPASGKVGGPLVIRAGHLGIGDDWEDGGTSITTGSPQNWIHSGTTLLGGTSGNAIRVGENAVFVIVAFGSLHPSPKIESLKFTIDGKEKPVIQTGFATKRSDFKVKEFDNALIWKETTTVLGRIFVSADYGTTVKDIPYLIGAAYLKEPQTRVHDPYDLVGTSANRDVNKVIYTT
jgi:hypothetical protein